MSGMIDFHSHILPGIDDGSDSLEMSLRMMRLEAEQGIKRVVATPHFYPQYDSPDRFLKRRYEAESQLREEISRHPGLPELTVGGEVYFFPHMSHVDALRDLTIAGTEYILIEMPAAPWTSQMYQELERIYINQGLTPIIAHVERYLGPFLDNRVEKRLADLPVLVQSNASFLMNGNRGLRMLRKHQIHLLGSDCHNMTERKPNLEQARQRIIEKLGAEALEWINANGREVLG